MQVHFFRPPCFTDFSKMISISRLQERWRLWEAPPISRLRDVVIPSVLKAGSDWESHNWADPMLPPVQPEWEVGLDMSPGSSLILLVWKLPISSLVPFCMQHFREDDLRCFTFRWLYGSTINRELTGQQPDNVLFINAAQLPDWIINRVL